MTWDPTQPTDTTKIRLAPGVIRVNWNAIEQGGVPYDKLQLQEQAGNPTRKNDTGWLFSKQASSQSELFYEDDRNPAKVIQITNNGGIGTTSQLLYGSAVITSGTYQNTQNAFVSAWAYVASNGTLTAGFGLTSAKSATGEYTLTFSTALSNANYAVVGSVFTTLTRARVLYVPTKATTNFTVRTQAINASAGSYEDASFMVAVFGGR